MYPFITIGITAFNCQDSIERAMRSALAQTSMPLELIVVDDASTDGTVERALEVGLSDRRVRVLRHESNLGVAGARNTVIAAAKGTFIAFFDDDDESDPDRVVEQWKRITDYERDFASGGSVICHTARLQYSSDGAKRIEKTMGCNIGSIAPHGPAVAARILWGEQLEDGYGAVATCSQMARTQTYKSLGGFDLTFRRSEDTEFCVRAALAGGHFVGLNQPLVRQALTQREDKTLANELLYKSLLLDKYRQTAGSDTRYHFSRRWLVLKTHWHHGDKMLLLKEAMSLALRHPLLTAERLTQALPNFGWKRSVAHFQRHEGS
jgi:glycosyltransferase involved in cell wall biosynthesis